MAMRRPHPVSAVGFQPEPASSSSDAVADAFSSMAVVSALVFGFAVSTLVALIAEWDEFPPLVCTACVLMAVVSALTAYSTVFMTLLYYFLKRILSEAVPGNATIFISATFRGRRLARRSTCLGFMIYLIALGVLAMERMPLYASVLVAALMLAGAAAVFVSWITVTQCSSQAFLIQKAEKIAQARHSRQAGSVASTMGPANSEVSRKKLSEALAVAQTAMRLRLQPPSPSLRCSMGSSSSKSSRSPIGSRPGAPLSVASLGETRRSSESPRVHPDQPEEPEESKRS